MPTYEYHCNGCGGFDAMRSYELRDAPATCPACGDSDCGRIFASAPRLGVMARNARRATEINERARHEPIRSKDYQRYKHPAGCGCCSGQSGKSRATVTTPEGAKFAPAKRPWMISH
ncbi:zinc ribbon domain-containing protein [Corticibacter populi]|uniref:Zinc ribbon domain-containing protein n=1 Tax=Corticibacter populi TaxID=1550736 RepID=A0A3M6QYP6_9BURK|nr:FmdB family zinc ribbon protein [Corticibacter populi]RMX07739.1 zinc ribbon domain-containing protein [Corticibacter populi]RZS34957.1 putative FmdB family regulatory protein [Corticibacter populi]